jgi:quercetin dioxygenase-like cupin family protein
MPTFSSKDFSQTKATIRPEIPDRLIHRKVWGELEDEVFSAERKHPVYLVDLPSRTLSVTLGGLSPKQASNRHRHNYETILYILEGEGTTVIEGREVQWKAGDAVYIPVWAWHHHQNASNTEACRYIACENAPLLQNLGGIAVREEG